MRAFTLADVTVASAKLYRQLSDPARAAFHAAANSDFKDLSPVAGLSDNERFVIGQLHFRCLAMPRLDAVLTGAWRPDNIRAEALAQGIPAGAELMNAEQDARAAMVSLLLDIDRLMPKGTEEVRREIRGAVLLWSNDGLQTIHRAADRLGLRWPFGPHCAPLIAAGLDVPLIFVRILLGEAAE